MKFSKFTYAFNTENGVCLYHSLLMKKAFLDKAEWGTLKSYYESVSEIESHVALGDSLYEQGFLVEGNEDDRLYSQARQRILNDVSLDTLVIIPTNSCNLHCEYCYAKSYLEPPNRMDGRIALKGLETFARQSQVKPIRHIVFLGGEPLLAPDVVNSVLGKSRELLQTGLLKAPTAFAIATNGTLINERVIERCLDYGVFLGVSLDGKRQHNILRRTKGGREVFDLVSGNLRHLRREGCEFSIDATVTTLNVLELDEIVEYFITEFEPKSIGLTLLIGEENASLRPDAAITTDRIISAYQKAKSHGVPESRITIQLEAFCNERLRECECRITNSQVVLDSSGRIGPSQELVSDHKWFVDSHLDHFDLRDDLFLKFELSNPFFIRTCEKCPAIGICGGGSQYDRLSRNNSLEIPSEYYCTYAKRVLNWMIARLAEEGHTQRSD